MSATAPFEPPTPGAPIALSAPVAPDATWATVRERVMAELATTADATDHNAPDPGVTLAEAAALGAATLHYRVAEAGFHAWPLGWRGWLDQEDRHWHASLPAGTPAEPSPPAELTLLADTLQTVFAIDGSLERTVRECASRADAEELLVGPTWAPHIPIHQRGAVIAVLRRRFVRQLALEHTDVIGDAVTTADAQGGTTAARNARAADDLAWRLPLWRDEVEGLVRRERRRLEEESVAARRTAVDRVATPADRSAVIAALTDAGLSPDAAAVAASRPRVPVGVSPEDLEQADGHSKVWPPHPVQALTCEPVTGDDYARRARLHPAVGRAWAVPGRLNGIAWHGLPTPPASGPNPPVPRRYWREDLEAPALTLVVDRTWVPAGYDELSDNAKLAADREFLRNVLALAIGNEVRAPFPIWRDDVDAAQPHRLVADEVGAALLKRVDVVVQATLTVPVTAERATVVADAAAAVEAFFESGRPETLTDAVDDPLSGPWPPAPQPSGGWVPGAPVRFSEVVEQLVNVRDVLGVTALEMRVDGDPVWTTDSALAIDPGCIPVLAQDGCFETTFAVEGACDA